VYQVIGQYPALLTPRNRMWIHFMSHKAARLMMPWAMLAAFLASFGLVPPWNGSALAVQVAGYCLAGVDFLIPNGVAPKRLTAPVRTFVVLMAASLCAVSIFFVPAGSLWGETRVSGAANPRSADGTSD
jgi:hypothetical protein